jgi:hypothetical protein
MKKATLRARMEINARAFNKYIYVKSMSDSELLANCHPVDRVDFKNEILKTQKIEE